MNADQHDALEWMEKNATRVPQIMTLERTTTSKYTFYLLARHYRGILGLKPQFHAYSKDTVDETKALIEEHSIFEPNGTLYVLEGFSRKFVDALNPAHKHWIVAETDGGTLVVPPFTAKTTRRNILKTLVNQLSLGKALPLSFLLKFDWTGIRSMEDYEPLLRRAKLLQLSAENLQASLEAQDKAWAKLPENSRPDKYPIHLLVKGTPDEHAGKLRTNPLTQTKRGAYKDLLQDARRAGWQSAHTFLILLFAKLIHYRALRNLGQEPAKARDALELNWFDATALEEAQTTLTDADVRAFGERLVTFDRLVMSNPELGLALFYLNNPISVRK